MDEAGRLQYLDAMGITVWRLRDSPAAADESRPRPTGAEDAAIAAELTESAVAPAAGSPAPHTEGRPGAASERPSSVAETGPPLDEPPPWSDDDIVGLPFDEVGHLPPDLFQDEVQPVATPNPIAAMDWPALKEAVAGCRACGLCEGRTNTVFGVGNEQAELMFVGEGPGQDEDRKGEPFVGRAGQLLNRMLAAVDLTREQVYIANIVKCRPPNNRNPNPDEAAACRAYLDRQIALIRPRLIVSLGAVSANNLLGNTESVGRLRGRSHQFRPADGSPPIPLIVTYHPSYYLRSPADKAKGWQDLQRIVRSLSSQA
jgi:DNA polymerase